MAAIVLALVACSPVDEPFAEPVEGARVIADESFARWDTGGLGAASDWSDRTGCDDVAKLFRGRDWSIDDLDVELTRDEVEASYEAHSAARQVVLDGPFGKVHTRLPWVFEAEWRWRENVLASYSVFGRELGTRTRSRLVSPWLAAFPGGAAMSAGGELTWEEYSETSLFVYRSLREACSTPPDDSPQPIDDPTLDLPEATLLYRPALGASLRQVRSDGLDESRPWGQPHWAIPRVSRDGSEVLVDTENSFALAAADGHLLHAVESPFHLECMSWAYGPALPFIALATRFEPGKVRVSRSLTDHDLRRDFFVPDDFRCPIDLADHVAFTGSQHGATGIWLTDKAGNDLRQIFAPDGCATFLAGASPDGYRLPVAVGCVDPYQSGLYVIDVRDRSILHLVSGGVAYPQFSADGEWLLFGYSRPRASLDDVDAWIMRADGSQARKLVENATFPTLILDADLE